MEQRLSGVHAASVELLSLQLCKSIYIHSFNSLGAVPGQNPGYDSLVEIFSIFLLLL
jgi:hypothetical protein